MHKRVRLFVAFCLMLPLIAVAKTNYVTDKVLVGVYEEPDTDSKLLKVIPTGTPLEILERKGKLALVRTSDGLEGWLDSTYTIDHKPAQHVVLELADKQKQTQQELDEANKRAAALDKQIKQLKIKNRGESKDKDASADIKKALITRETELEQANNSIKDLEDKLAAMEKQLADNAKQADAAPAADPADLEKLKQELLARDKTIEALNQRINAVSQAIGQEPASISTTSSSSTTNEYLWIGLAAVSALVLGFLIALLLAQRNSMRRHGGFRIHLNT